MSDVTRKLSRRQMLGLVCRATAGLAGLQAVVACAPKVVEKTVEVPKTVEVVVEKQVTTTPAPVEPVKIRVACYDLGEARNKAGNDVIAEFMKEQPNISVKFEWRPFDAYWDKLQTEFAAAVAPDVTINQIDWVVPGAARGMFLSLSPYVLRDQVDLSAYWYAHSLEWEWKGELYGGLLYASGQAHFVNTDLLKEAELDLPGDDWTWDDLLEYAKMLTNPDKNQWGVYSNWNDPPGWGASFIHGAGGTVLNETSDKCTLTSPEAQEGLQYLADLIHVHKVMPTPAAVQGQTNPFTAGKVAIYIGGSWEEGDIRTAGLNWEYVRMPVHPKTGKRSVQLGSNAWSILANTQHREEAWQLVRFLMGEKGQTAFMQYGLPGLKSVINSDAYLESHKPQNVKTQIADFECCSHNYYPTPDWGELLTVMGNEMGVIWSGEATVAEATGRACTALDEVFARRPPEWN